MNKKQQSNQNEEFGMELGDINAVKFYELQAGKKNEENKKKTKENQKGGAE
ncbi:hypothetical protein KHA96_18345 [Bacillus sp. FJAT-49711]|uniref:hypothetical protein n=1 Tax=Bacillus sp. FJAT-49711 TaxID=2833585 RepID=UPI001BCA16CE|nr:hypothetical protein [Bacillus sp. FJAT-49711]MBS4220265.1 hypothetical protein [Bacillus sp. FJAT-49711]